MNSVRLNSVNLKYHHVAKIQGLEKSGLCANKNVLSIVIKNFKNSSISTDLALLELNSYHNRRLSNPFYL